MVCLKSTWEIVLMDAKTAPHEKMLWSFGNLTVNLEEVRFFKCFEAKVVIGIVSVVVDFCLNKEIIVENYLVDVFCNEGGRSISFVLNKW
jgi:hypothetical protein